VKSLLVIIIAFFSTNAISATLNGLSWSVEYGSMESIQSTYESCGISGGNCDGSSARWASQGEFRQLIRDLYNIDFGPDESAVNVDTSKIFDFLGYWFTESYSKHAIIFTSALISETDGSPKYGAGGYNSIQEYMLSDYNPAFDKIYAATKLVGTGGMDSLMDWYYSGHHYYPFGLLMVSGEYDPSLGMPGQISEVPLPASLLLFAPALLGFIGLRRKRS
jgi:hypothetical protein